MSDYTILIIDYDPRSIERATGPLQDAGFRVEVARDGVTGMQAFETLKPDLVLIEAMIPKKHGFEVCQEIKKTPHGKSTPVLIMTAVYRGRKYRTQALHIYGCDDYLEKPLSNEDLLNACRRALESSPPGAEVAEAEERDPENREEASPSAPAPESSGPSLSPIVGDLTEDEIMKRLDALLPSDDEDGGLGWAAAEAATGATAAAAHAAAAQVQPDSVPVSRPEPEERVPVGGGGIVDDLPIGDEPESGPAEEAAGVIGEGSPVEAGDSELAESPAPDVLPEDSDGEERVVPFETGRSRGKRKRKKGRKKKAKESEAAAETAGEIDLGDLEQALEEAVSVLSARNEQASTEPEDQAAESEVSSSEIDPETVEEPTLVEDDEPEVEPEPEVEVAAEIEIAAEIGDPDPIDEANAEINEEKIETEAGPLLESVADPEELPEQTVTEPLPPAAKGNLKKRWPIGLAALIVAGLLIGLFFILRGDGDSEPVPGGSAGPPAANDPATPVKETGGGSLTGPGQGESAGDPASKAGAGLSLPATSPGTTPTRAADDRTVDAGLPPVTGKEEPVPKRATSSKRRTEPTPTRSRAKTPTRTPKPAKSPPPTEKTAIESAREETAPSTELEATTASVSKDPAPEEESTGALTSKIQDEADSGGRPAGTEVEPEISEATETLAPAIAVDEGEPALKPDEAPSLPSVATQVPEVNDSPAEPEPTPERQPEPEPPKVQRGDLLDLWQVDTQPVSLQRRLPAYPPVARRLRQQGAVKLNILIDENGKATMVELLEGIPGSALNDAAIKAARSWTYKPAMKDGVPVRVWKVEKVLFKL
jgi:TonB family protein